MTTDPTESSNDTTSDSATNHTHLSRRRVLQGLAATGAAGAFGLGTASAGGHTLDISLWQTERMASLARIRRGDPAYAQMQAKKYVKTYCEALIGPSDVFDAVRVRIRSPAVDLDLASEYDNPEAGIVYRLLDWNGRLQAEYEPSTHANLILDTPRDTGALGIAFNDPADKMDGKMTDSGVLDYSEYLLDLDPDHQPPGQDEYTLLINNEQGMNPGIEVGMAAAHEVGHNLSLNHNEGEGRYAGEGDTIPAATTMTGIYVIFYGALKDDPRYQGKIPPENACHVEWPDVEATVGSFGITSIADDIAIYPTTASECEIRSFNNDARDLAGKSAASMGTGPSLAQGAPMDAPEAVPDGAEITLMPQALQDMWPDPEQQQ